ncbi:hypothetical protein [Vibrio hyugaensis]|uniref:Uncharacterized protein n=1 Tax=Vibrio hyugaensis TaxID=1534743 RepID=A0ABQ5Y321_9VIBR|nr:hypothetical protein [Vibrio hyugaensis]GLR04838.1 hypothetical protein GCM10007906_24260 [Vibrio hyugaensis]
MPVAISFLFSFALMMRTKPHSWGIAIHVLTHVLMLVLIPADYVIQYLMVMFFSSPFLIRLAKQSPSYDILFAFLPLLIGTGGLVLSY